MTADLLGDLPTSTGARPLEVADMPAWRFRRCPKCHAVRRAGEFRCMDVGPRWGYGPAATRSCPACGFEALTYEFSVVRERHPDRAEVPE